MQKWHRVINEKTKEVEVGLGTNEAFYKSLGYILGDVEQAYNGQWYLFGHAIQIPLEELKEAKRTEINKARDEAEQGGFEYMGKVFDSDPISCQRISCAAQAMQSISIAEDQSESIITWTCQDNSTIDLTPAELIGLVGALALWSNTCHQKATTLKKQIETAMTAEELKKIQWDTTSVKTIKENNPYPVEE